MSNEKGSGELASVILLAIILGFCCLKGIVKQNWNEHTKVITVNKFERTGGDSSKYLVFTTDEVYTVKDAFWRGSWNASDRYGKIEKGKQYKCTIVGWRWGFTSSYKNLLTVEEVKKSE